MNLPKRIAELCWWYDAWKIRSSYINGCGKKEGPKNLALHLKISEDVVLDIMKSDEYRKCVKKLMLRRSPADLKKWLDNTGHRFP